VQHLAQTKNRSQSLPEFALRCIELAEIYLEQSESVVVFRIPFCSRYIYKFLLPQKDIITRTDISLTIFMNLLNRLSSEKSYPVRLNLFSNPIHQTNFNLGRYIGLGKLLITFVKISK
jgi:hypothetical protein